MTCRPSVGRTTQARGAKREIGRYLLESGNADRGMCSTEPQLAHSDTDPFFCFVGYIYSRGPLNSARCTVRHSPRTVQGDGELSPKKRVTIHTNTTNITRYIAGVGPLN